MTTPSNCHNADGEFAQEREGLAATLQRIGLEPPTFDRQTFVRVIGTQDLARTHDRKSHQHNMHWSGARHCSFVTGERWVGNCASARILTANAFKALRSEWKCKNCMKSIQQP